MTTAHASRDHSRMSGSKLERIILCPGSLQACAGLPEPEPSPEALEGTDAHEKAESWLRLALMPPDLTAEQESALQFYVDECFSHRGTYLIEQSLPLDGIVPLRGQYSLCDFIAIDPPFMDVVDLKYGEGVLVFAPDNTQLAAYGMAAINAYAASHGVEVVRLKIVQPRRQHVSTWELGVEALRQFCADRIPDLALALWENPVRIPGAAQCRFCAAAPTCPEKARDAAQAIARTELGGDLTLREKAALVVKKGIIDSSFRDWSVQIRAALMLGNDVPGFTLKPGRQNRTWLDPEQVKQKLRDNAWIDPKLISVAQAEKRGLLIDGLEHNVLVERGPATLAPVQ